MSPYEERLQEDVDDISQRVVDLGRLVNRAVKNAVRALLTGNRQLAYETILGDHHINREVAELDRLCHVFVVRHLPSARHLRMVSAVLRIAHELERIGDYAGTIGRETAQLEGEPPRGVARAIELLGEQSRGMLKQAVKAFREESTELARGTMAIERQIDITFDKVLSDLFEEDESECSRKDLFAMLVVLNRLERVSDRAKNICVEIVFWTTGEGKDPKVFKILFLDERNSCVSQMAEAVARKAFPEGARYYSAGWRPAPALNEHVVEFMEGQGCDVSGQTPKELEPGHDMVSDLHVVIGLGCDPTEHITEVPFHTVLLQWDVGGCPKDREQAAEVYRRLANEIRELMETLHGEHAS